ncbi:hypothetical protein [Robiginitalea sediminis]|uniref:hypothetical protein n=1 Tax=Robiginitalea sediminis TaxID=1982593 RepID=UPI000B4B8851|nr:hypothetical protein [Robiginitalea sediminis]
MEPASSEFSPKGFFRTHRIIHLALLAGLTIFGLVQFNRVGGAEMAWGQMDYLFPYGIPLLAMGGILAGSVVFRQQLSAVTKLETLQARMNGYLSACLTRYALLEAPGFLALSAYGTSGNAAYLGVALALWIALLLLYPTPERAVRDLQLPPPMQEALRKGLK